MMRGKGAFDLAYADGMLYLMLFEAAAGLDADSLKLELAFIRLDIDGYVVADNFAF